MENQVKKHRKESAIIVENVVEHKYKDDVLSAQLRQTIKTTSIYPGKNSGNDKQDSLFEAAEFGGAPKVYENEQVRVCWIEVPLGTTKEQVQAKIDSLGDQARIYQIVSTNIQDCLTSGHRFHISEGTLTMEQLEAKFALVDGDSGERITSEAGEQLYRALYFSTSAQADISSTSIAKVIEKEESASSDEVA